MAALQPRFQSMFLAFILGVVVIIEVTITFFTFDPVVRVLVGLGLLGIIMWLSGRLGMVEYFNRFIERRFKRRVYQDLRGNLEHFIVEVRRLNWLAAGIDQGIRTKESAQQEMDALEHRLHEIVGLIRRSAGYASVPESQVEGDRSASRPEEARQRSDRVADAAPRLDEGVLTRP